jgi:hypothetical protein
LLGAGVPSTGWAIAVMHVNACRQHKTPTVQTNFNALVIGRSECFGEKSE